MRKIVISKSLKPNLYSQNDVEGSSSLSIDQYFVNSHPVQYLQASQKPMGDDLYIKSSKTDGTHNQMDLHLSDTSLNMRSNGKSEHDNISSIHEALPEKEQCHAYENRLNILSEGDDIESNHEANSNMELAQDPQVSGELFLCEKVTSYQ